MWHKKAAEGKDFEPTETEYKKLSEIEGNLDTLDEKETATFTSPNHIIGLKKNGNGTFTLLDQNLPLPLTLKTKEDVIQAIQQSFNIKLDDQVGYRKFMGLSQNLAIEATLLQQPGDQPPSAPGAPGSRK